MRMTLTLACLCSLCLVPESGAGTLDEELNKQMPVVMEALKKGKVTNVGVMRFRVHEEGKKPHFDAPACDSLAERVENLLVIHGGPSETPAVGVIRNAGRVAGRAMVGPWFSEPSEREKLFDMRYPLAWGDRQVKPDLFLTGKLELSKDCDRATLTIESFDRERPEKLVTVATLHVATDRSILRDLGYDIGLRIADREALAGKPGVSAEQEDKFLIAAYNGRKGREGSDPNDIAGIVFQVLVNGKPVPCNKKDGGWVLVSPPSKAKIEFRLINRAGKRLAVAVRLNGLNTIDEQRDEPELCKKWITEPKKRYTIEGFHMLGEETTEISPFVVLVGADAKAARAEYRDAAGRIDLDVYEEGNAALAVASLVSSRGLPPSKEKEARGSYLALRSALLKSAKLKTLPVKSDEDLVAKKEIIVADKDQLRLVRRPDEKDFPSPRLVSRLTIRVVPAR